MTCDNDQHFEVPSRSNLVVLQRGIRNQNPQISNSARELSWREVESHERVFQLSCAQIHETTRPFEKCSQGLKNAAKEPLLLTTGFAILSSSYLESFCSHYLGNSRLGYVCERACERTLWSTSFVCIPRIITCCGSTKML